MSQADAIPELLLSQARAGDGALRWASSSSCTATISG